VVRVTLAKNGIIRYNSIVMGLKEFAQILANEIQMYGETDVIIEADPDVRHGIVADLMNEATKIGVHKIEFAQVVTREAQ